MPINTAFDGDRHALHGNTSTTESLRLLQRPGDRQRQGMKSPSERIQKDRKRAFVNQFWVKIVLIALALMSCIGLVRQKLPDYPSKILSYSVEENSQYDSSGPRTLRSFYVDRAVDHYPFTGLADTSKKHSDNDTAFYWHIPRSGGTTLKHIFGKCLHLTQSSRTSADYCDVEAKDLHVCHTRLGAFVNADTSDNHGIQRAHEMKLVASGLSDVIISSRFLHVASLFDPDHAGRAFTVIRDPLERAVSTFYYLKSADWEPTHKDMYNEMTLMEYIHRDDTGSDWMVRWLTGKQSEPVLTDKDLKLAKEILKKKFFILLTEEMAVGVERLIQYMGWELKDEYRACVHENVARVSRHNKSIHPHVDVGSKEYLALKSRNKLDFELYDYALELFHEQWALLSQVSGETESTGNQKPSTSM